jgi:hypothetical protein
MGAITGWIDDTFAYSKRFNGNDFPRYCLVVVIGGASPMKRNFGSAFFEFIELSLCRQHVVSFDTAYSVVVV